MSESEPQAAKQPAHQATPFPSTLIPDALLGEIAERHRAGVPTRRIAQWLLDEQGIETSHASVGRALHRYRRERLARSAGPDLSSGATASVAPVPRPRWWPFRAQPRAGIVAGVHLMLLGFLAGYFRAAAAAGSSIVALSAAERAPGPVPGENPPPSVPVTRDPRKKAPHTRADARQRVFDGRPPGGSRGCDGLVAAVDAITRGEGCAHPNRKPACTRRNAGGKPFQADHRPLHRRDSP